MQTLKRSPPPANVVYRITLGNTEFEGSNAVYLLATDDSVVLIDAGAATPTVRSDLRAGLDRAGYAVSDLDAILLTHWHFDHAGLAGELASESGATVYAHEADEPLIAGREPTFLEVRDRRETQLVEWGVPEDAREELSAFVEGHLDVGGEPVSVTPIADGDTIHAAGVELDPVHLPGHAAGLVGYTADADLLAATAGDESVPVPESAADRVAFTGDAVLPKYTPNVGGADVRVESPLADYIDSLQRVIDAEWAIAYPGHRDPIRDPAGRAATILRHHRERTQRVIDTLREAPATPWGVSAELFGDLHGIHILHGPGEAFAHLNHLVADGVAERDGRRYRLVESDPAIDRLVPPPDTARGVEPTD